MPQLKSGRHIAVSASPIEDIIQHGTDEQKSLAIMSYRLNITSPANLIDLLSVAYFRNGEVSPPGESYNSGFLVRDVFDGKAGWTDDEVMEFKAWLHTDERAAAWLQSQFEAINKLIVENPLWNTPLWTDP